MQKRTVLKGLGALALYPVAGCSVVQPEPPPKVVIEAKDIKSVGHLIEEMRKGAGKFAPKEIDLDEVYQTIADAFVAYARDAIELGIAIPKQIVEKLPLRKKTAVPAMVIFALWGVTFIVPIKAFFDAALGSLVVLGLFIGAAISAAAKGKGKEKI